MRAEGGSRLIDSGKRTVLRVDPWLVVGQRERVKAGSAIKGGDRVRSGPTSARPPPAGGPRSSCAPETSPRSTAWSEVARLLSMPISHLQASASSSLSAYPTGSRHLQTPGHPAPHPTAKAAILSLKSVSRASTSLQTPHARHSSDLVTAPSLQIALSFSAGDDSPAPRPPAPSRAPA